MGSYSPQDTGRHHRRGFQASEGRPLEFETWPQGCVIRASYLNSVSFNFLLCKGDNNGLDFIELLRDEMKGHKEKNDNLVSLEVTKFVHVRQFYFYMQIITSYYTMEEYVYILG